MSDWTDADYGREDGRADALAGREPDPDAFADINDDEWARAYREAYDAALAELAPDNVRPVSP